MKILALVLGFLACGDPLNSGAYQGEEIARLSGTIEGLDDFKDARKIHLGLLWRDHLGGQFATARTRLAPVTMNAFPFGFSVALLEIPESPALIPAYFPEAGAVQHLVCVGGERFECTRSSDSTWACSLWSQGLVDECNSFSLDHRTGNTTAGCTLPRSPWGDLGSPVTWDQQVVLPPDAECDEDELIKLCIAEWEGPGSQCKGAYCSCGVAYSKRSVEDEFGFANIIIFDDLDADGNFTDRDRLLGIAPQNMLVFVEKAGDNFTRFQKRFGSTFLNAQDLQPGYNLVRPVCKQPSDLGLVWGGDLLEVVPFTPLLIEAWSQHQDSFHELCMNYTSVLSAPGFYGTRIDTDINRSRQLSSLDEAEAKEVCEAVHAAMQRSFNEDSLKVYACSRHRICHTLGST